MPRTASLLLMLLPLTAWADDPLAEQPARPAVARPVGVEEVRKKLGLLADYNSVPIKNVKVAVLDYGFEGVDGTRPYLPANTVVVEHYGPEFVRRNGLGDPAYQKPFMP